jgi:GNAT superfamily N-acetyltransferase
MTVDFRLAIVGDAGRVADIYLLSRKELVACAPLAHSDEEIRDWIRQRLIPLGRTTVAVVDSMVVGFISVSRTADCSWIEHLYLHPAWVGHGIGSRLLELARSELPPPIRLYTFQVNHRARSFYERHGFEAVNFSDGSRNEEKCPDVLYEWRTGALPGRW